MLTLDNLKAELVQREKLGVYDNFVQAAGTEAGNFVNTFQADQAAIVANFVANAGDGGVNAANFVSVAGGVNAADFVANAGGEGRNAAYFVADAGHDGLNAADFVANMGGVDAANFVGNAGGWENAANFVANAGDGVNAADFVANAGGLGGYFVKNFKDDAVSLANDIEKTDDLKKNEMINKIVEVFSTGADTVITNFVNEFNEQREVLANFVANVGANDAADFVGNAGGEGRNAANFVEEFDNVDDAAEFVANAGGVNAANFVDNVVGEFLDVAVAANFVANVGANDAADFVGNAGGEGRNAANFVKEFLANGAVAANFVVYDGGVNAGNFVKNAGGDGVNAANFVNYANESLEQHEPGKLVEIVGWENAGNFVAGAIMLGDSVGAPAVLLADLAAARDSFAKYIIDAIKVKRDADFNALLKPVSGYTWVLRET